MTITINSPDGWTAPQREPQRVRSRTGANADFSQALSDERESDTGGRQSDTSPENGGHPDTDALDSFRIEARRAREATDYKRHEDKETGPHDEAGEGQATANER